MRQELSRFDGVRRELNECVGHVQALERKFKDTDEFTAHLARRFSGMQKRVNEEGQHQDRAPRFSNGRGSRPPHAGPRTTNGRGGGKPPAPGRDQNTSAHANTDTAQSTQNIETQGTPERSTMTTIVAAGSEDVEVDYDDNTLTF